MMIEYDLPLLELFNRLRKAGFPIGIDEYQLLLRALQAGFGIPDDDVLQGDPRTFYYDALKRLCQTLWVKSVEEIPLFNYHFKLIVPQPKGAAPQSSNTRSKDEITPTATSSSSSGTPSTPTPTPATTSELVSTVADEVEVTQAVASLQADSRSDEVQYSKAIRTDEYFPVTRRQMKQSWRHLRRPMRQGPPTELDVEATVHEIGRQGMLFDPVLVPRRINRAELLLLIDQDGSMVPFHPLSRRLAETAARGGRLGSVAIYYFHNYPLEHLYRDPTQVEAEPIQIVLDKLHQEQTGVLIFSDAGAARGSYSWERLIGTREFLQRLKEHFRYVAWLNPMPASRWHNTTADKIKYLVPMYDISQRGLENAISVLRGRPVHSYILQGTDTHG